eukprot:scaffold203068_cov45-Prasinocladus_malaysianus.AAC.1
MESTLFILCHFRLGGSHAEHCMGDVGSLPSYLEKHSPIHHNTPLLLGLDRADISATDLSRIVSDFEAMGYKIYVSNLGANYPREIRAAVQFQLALKSSMFMGNSVSTFTAAIMLARQSLG